MSVTQKIFEAFLKCPTKSHLYSEGVADVRGEFDEWQQYLQERFKQAGWRQFGSTVPENELYLGTPPLRALEDGRYRVIINYTVDLPIIHSRLDALEVSPSSHS